MTQEFGGHDDDVLSGRNDPTGQGWEGLDDHDFAARLATGAGELLLGLRARPAGAGNLGEEGDLHSNEYLLRAIREHRSGDQILSEESEDDPVRLEARRVWIIDPLDGTREYTEAGRTDWAVHVALWEDDALAAGAVALPARGLLLRDDDPARPSGEASTAPRVVVSRTRPPAIALDIAAVLGGSIFPLGSAGAKTAAVVLGEAEAYVHAGGQYEWDSAAPVAVAVAAGLHASRIDGSPLVYNRSDPRLPDLLICRPELAEPIIETVMRRSAAGRADD